MREKLVPKKLSRKLQNRVVLTREGVVTITIIGDQNGRTARKVLLETQNILNKLYEREHPKLILVDFTRIGKETKESIKVAGHFTQLGYDRLAVFGLKPRLERIAHALIAATRNTKRAKVFKSEEDAREWLLSKWAPVGVKPGRFSRLMAPFGVLLMILLAVAASSN